MFRSSKQLAAAGLRVGCSRTPHGRLLSPALSPTIAIRGLVHTEIITKPLLQSYTFRSSSSTPAHRTNGVLPCVTAAYGLPGQISATERGGARVPLRGKLHVDVYVTFSPLIDVDGVLFHMMVRLVHEMMPRKSVHMLVCVLLIRDMILPSCFSFS